MDKLKAIIFHVIEFPEPIRVPADFRTYISFSSFMLIILSIFIRLVKQFLT